MKRTAFRASLIVCLLTSHILFVVRAQTPVAGVRAYRSAHEAEIIAELVDLLSIPNVASDTVNIRRNAAKLIDMMGRRGIEARLLEGSGPPAIFGEMKTPGAARTIGFYAHYDGQPVEPSKWATDPFKPTLRDKPLEAGGRGMPFPKAGARFDPEWRLYARSASDDKAPIIAIFAALDALKTSRANPTANLKFLFDGEEEAGSPHLGDIADSQRWAAWRGRVDMRGWTGASITPAATLFWCARDRKGGHHGLRGQSRAAQRTLW